MTNLRLYTIYKYFQLSIKHKSSILNLLNLNYKHLQIKKGIYSKHKLNQLIPKKNKLISQKLSEFQTKPKIKYPIILKPDWGESSLSIFKINSNKELKEIIKQKEIRIDNYFIQEFDNSNIEYDIIFIKNIKTNQLEISEITTVSTKNKDKITGINNNSIYKTISNKFTPLELNQILQNLSWLKNKFNIGKITLKANSHQDLILNLSKVIEINILFPLPNSIHTNSSITHKKQLINNHLEKIIKLSKQTKKQITLSQTLEFYIKNQIHKYKLLKTK
jgi:hypothetical protein